MAAVCQLGCGAKGDWSAADIAAQPGAKVGDLTRCTVSGAVFRVTKDSTRFTVDGQTYFACCDGCAEVFKKNPERFVRTASNSTTP